MISIRLDELNSCVVNDSVYFGLREAPAVVSLFA